MNYAMISGIEFFTHHDQLMVIYNGHTSTFENASIDVLDTLCRDLENRPEAEKALEEMNITNPIARLRKYAECRYGALDATPDFVNGIPQKNDEMIYCERRQQCPGNGKLCVNHYMLENEQRISIREMEVIKLLGDGLSTREAAQKLFVCEATVRMHVMHVKEKLNISTHAGLGAFSAKMGLS